MRPHFNGIVSKDFDALRLFDWINMKLVVGPDRVYLKGHSHLKVALTEVHQFF
jgi:hypothetical protein